MTSTRHMVVPAGDRLALLHEGRLVGCGRAVERPGHGRPNRRHADRDLGSLLVGTRRRLRRRRAGAGRAGAVGQGTRRMHRWRGGQRLQRGRTGLTGLQDELSDANLERLEVLCAVEKLEDAPDICVLQCHVPLLVMFHSLRCASARARSGRPAWGTRWCRAAPAGVGGRAAPIRTAAGGFAGVDDVLDSEVLYGPERVLYGKEPGTQFATLRVGVVTFRKLSRVHGFGSALHRDPSPACGRAGVLLLNACTHRGVGGVGRPVYAANEH